MSYSETTEKVKQTLDTSEMRQALFEAVDKRGNKLEFIIHKNTSNTIRDLLKAGKAHVFYSLNPSRPVTVEGGVATHFVVSENSNDGMFAHSEKGVGIFKNRPFLGRIFRERRDKNKTMSYPVTAGQIDTVYEMIERGENPQNILAYLVDGD